MIEDSVEHDSDSELFSLLRERQQLFLAAPFGTLAALLVELSKVVQVIDVIASSLRIGTFACLFCHASEKGDRQSRYAVGHARMNYLRAESKKRKTRWTFTAY